MTNLVENYPSIQYGLEEPTDEYQNQTKRGSSERKLLVVHQFSNQVFHILLEQICESFTTAYLQAIVRFSKDSSELGEGRRGDRASKASQADSTNPDAINSGE